MRRHEQENIFEEGSLMGTARRRRRGWRMSRFRRRPKRLSKRSGGWPAEMIGDDESPDAEQTDRLLLSSLRFWEVERDLIEERMAARGRRSAA